MFTILVLFLHGGVQLFWGLYDINAPQATFTPNTKEITSWQREAFQDRRMDLALQDDLQAGAGGITHLNHVKRFKKQ